MEKVIPPKFKDGSTKYFVKESNGRFYVIGNYGRNGVTPMGSFSNKKDAQDYRDRLEIIGHSYTYL